jgi:hypothetical protein
MADGGTGGVRNYAISMVVTRHALHKLAAPMPEAVFFVW